MKNRVATTELSRLNSLDLSGTVLSVLCMAHCLVLPLLVSVLPTLRLEALSHEWLHQGLLLLVIPVVAFAVFRGYQHHGRRRVPVLGIIGVAALLVGGLWGHDLHLETPLTVVGSVFLVTTHLINARSCRDECAVPATNA